MKDNFAHILGFILNVIAVIGAGYFLLFAESIETVDRVFYSLACLLGGLVTGTILMTLGKILMVLQDMANK